MVKGSEAVVWDQDEIARAGAGGVVVGVPLFAPLFCALAEARPANAADLSFNWLLSIYKTPVLWANSRHVALSLVSTSILLHHPMPHRTASPVHSFFRPDLHITPVRLMSCQLVLQVTA